MSSEQPSEARPQSWRAEFRARLAELHAADLGRELPPPSSGEQGLLDLGSNDYLGLSRHPRVAEAARRALERSGTGARASRLLRGNVTEHVELESSLARLKSTDAALVFSSGYSANLGLLTALGEPEDVILCDRLSHASLVDGARLARAPVQFYRHGDPDHLSRQLARRRSAGHGRTWVVTDGVFSMDGVLAPLPSLLEVTREFDATLIVDDAHATGIVGPAGEGTVAHFGLDGEAVIQMGTLSKALGSQGGFVAGPRELVDWLVQNARSFIYSTGLSPASAAAAKAAIDVVADEPWRRERLQLRLEELRSGLGARGWHVVGEAPAPMCAVVVGEPAQALALAERLRSRGVIAPAIRPPTVPRGTSRVRLAPTADFGPEDVERVIEAFGSCDS